MLSAKAALRVSRGLAHARLMSGKAALVKSMAADQKAVAAAVAALGPDAKYATVKALVESEPHKWPIGGEGGDLSWTWAMLKSNPTRKH